MKRTKVGPYLIVSALFFLAACATLNPQGSQYAALHVAECME